MRCVSSPKVSLKMVCPFPRRRRRRVARKVGEDPVLDEEEVAEGMESSLLFDDDEEEAEASPEAEAPDAGLEGVEQEAEAE